MLERISCIVLATDAELVVVVLKIACCGIGPVDVSRILVCARVRWIPAHCVQCILSTVEVAARNELCTTDYRLCRCIPAHTLCIACPFEHRIMVICCDAVHVVVELSVLRDVAVCVKAHTLCKLTLTIACFMQGMGNQVDFIHTVCVCRL